MRVVVLAALGLLGLTLFPRPASARDVALYCHEIFPPGRWLYIPENIASPASLCWTAGIASVDNINDVTRIVIKCFGNEISTGPGIVQQSSAVVVLKWPIPQDGPPPGTFDWFKQESNWEGPSALNHRCALAFP